MLLFLVCVTNIHFIKLSFQYAFSTNTVLIDEEEDLFSTFHALMTHAVNIIGESFLSKNNKLSKNNDPLLWRVMCTSNGTESFKEVCESMVPKLTSLHDYMVRLLRIPSMKSGSLSLR